MSNQPYKWVKIAAEAEVRTSVTVGRTSLETQTGVSPIIYRYLFMFTQMWSNARIC